MNHISNVSRDDVFQDFASFLNDDEGLRRFIRACASQHRGTPRLRYWQQQLWTKFLESNELYRSLSEDEVIGVFLVCPIHRRPLVKCAIAKTRGHLDVTLSPDAEEFIFNQAPFSLPITHELKSEAGESELYLCDICVEARFRREAMRSSP